MLHLAQLNIARMIAPDINHPIMTGFVAQLDPINQLAEESDGFVWRLKGDGNDATDFRPFDDDRIIVNMSVWESPEQLQAFVFKSMHTEVMKDRRKWFERAGADSPTQLTTVLWWILTGHTPTVEEAKERLDHLNVHGSDPQAFTFRDIQPKPEEQLASASVTN